MGNKTGMKKKISFENFAMNLKVERRLVKEINEKFKIGDMIVAEFKHFDTRQGIFLGVFKRPACQNLILYTNDKIINIALGYQLKFLYKMLHET